MEIYWAILIVPILFGITQIHSDKYLSLVQWCIYGLLLVLLIGFRHEIGGDWATYLYKNTLYSGLGSVGFYDLFSTQYLMQDIGYVILHWISINVFNSGVYGTNFIVSLILVFGLFRICRMMPIPWLALVVAIPYLIIVVSMGYTRQSAAIGLVMWGLAELMSGNKGKFYITIFIAALFHKTAIFLVPIAMLIKFRHRSYRKIDLMVVIISIGILIAMASKIELMVFYYITDQEFKSAGSIVRILMNIMAGIVFFLYRKKWATEYKDTNIWLIFFIVSIFMLLLNFLSSTAADRLSLYLIPMQLVIFSRIPRLIKASTLRSMFIIGVILMYAFVLFVWLVFAHYSSYWLPYQNILIS